jgi:1-deoxy-D-xylulose-5-phosphate reductoisomerase
MLVLMAKRIAILGSTGSIGRSALRVIDTLGPAYEVFALTAHSNVELLAEQARRYRPSFAAVTNADAYERLRGLVGDLDVDAMTGPDALIGLARHEQVDIVLAAVVGAAGLPAVLGAARAW